MTSPLGREPVTMAQRTQPAGTAAAGRYVVSGTVVHGERRGRELGWPTANVETVASAVPPDGVYAGTVEVVGPGGGGYLAAVSVGDNPTFPGATRTVEAHLLGFSGDLYGRELVVTLLHKLRDLEAFDNLPDLVTAISTDVERTQVLLSGVNAELPSPR
ncbi:riboflavin kinase [Modestobacter sp. VKM Ac-2979]|uniref:riboflavin kinase n=1 Tax=unclassified Modestobacter TaxID=2643866 RepID=UPI0022ABA96D|nr:MULTISPECIES: riboflavin kinase [unclassified Modestobacter]MCZ2811967.1 riboflavin kinase [Modestobacter sp. VKM Ac-2979]MCZ2843691.1 riboflavin kinase [Modestobacter sp. VKM Ac-2980]